MAGEHAEHFNRENSITKQFLSDFDLVDGDWVQDAVGAVTCI